MDWILENFYQSTLIPCGLFEHGILAKNYSPNNLNTTFSSYITSYLDQHKAALGYTITEERIFMGYVRIENSDLTILIGPTNAFKVTDAQAKNLLKTLGLPQAQVNALTSALNRHARYTIEQSLHFLTMLDYSINHYQNRTIEFFSTTTHKKDRQTVTPEIPFLATVDGSMEKEILSYIQYGQIDLLQQSLNQLFASSMDIPPVSPNLEQTMKQLFTINVGVVSRTALRGGIDYSTMIEMTSYYLQKIDTATDFRQISSLIYEMFMSFAKAVLRQNQIATPTLLSKKIKQIIFSHLNEKITPTMIAKIIHMDVSYLCRHFKKETGMTITAFVKHVKITECQRLLTATDMAILDISVQLGFSSHHYMSKVFKEIVGMSPASYRRISQ